MGIGGLNSSFMNQTAGSTNNVLLASDDYQIYNVYLFATVLSNL